GARYRSGVDAAGRHEHPARPRLRAGRDRATAVDGALPQQGDRERLATVPGVLEIPRVCRLDAFSQADTVAPAERMKLADVEQLSRRPVGLRAVVLDRAVV